MATWKTHKCNSCDYFFTGSGKPDALFKGYTLPVVCSKCNEIYDRIIHSPIGEKLNGKCELLNIYESKKCPKCKDGIIDESDEGMVVMADKFQEWVEKKNPPLGRD